MGQLVGPTLELGVGPALGADDENLTVRDGVDGVLEEVGDVVGHGI